MRQANNGLKLFIILLLTLSACAVRVTQPLTINCPLPEVKCLPELWKGLAYDSSAETVRYLDKYYVFEQVKQINTNNDEWALSFITHKKAVLTYNDGTRQSIMMVKMNSENKGTIESGVGSSLEGSLGAISFLGDNAVFSYVPKEALFGNSNIYTGFLSGNLLMNAKPISDKVNKDKYSWESQPTQTPDGKAVFFASDNAVGFGGTDIWLSIKTKDGWSEPINCGENINTQCPELTPFVSRNGRQLYFASSGHQTMGGYDIFVSEISDAFYTAVNAEDINSIKNGGFFSKPKNLRPPLNTDADELFPSSPGDCDSLLYYSSNQIQRHDSTKKTGFDIYVRRVVYPEKTYREPQKIAEGGLPEEKFEIKIPETKPNLPVLYTVEGTVYNATTKEPLPEAEVTAKTKPEMSLYKQTNADVKGNYSIILEKDKEYELTAQSKDLFFDTFTISLEKTDTTSVVHKDFNVPVILTLRINFPTDVYNEPYKFTLDSNGIETSKQWENEMNNLAKNIIDSREFIKEVSLSGHTDEIASEAYNYQLGMRRVTFIIGELIKRGVAKELLKGRSAGELEPLDKRQEEDLQIYRKRLRRVELLKVLK